ncbi:MAG: family 78 glycoside hydrolase catalytic domain [Christensenellales bacterium]
MDQAQWVQGDRECEAPVFQREFEAESGAQGQLEICGLGYCRPFINGSRVGDDELTPVYSDYEYRKLDTLNYPINDTFRYRVYICRYDVSSLLRTGKNVLTAALGAGWYSQFRRRGEGMTGYGKPRLWFRLTLTGRDVRRVVSDEKTVWKPSFITENNLYYGETQDARLWDRNSSSPASASADWLPVILPQIDPVPMMPMDCPPDRVIRRLQPRLLGVKEGRRVYDVGENITGRLTVLADAPADSITVCRFGENLTKEGNVDFRSCGSWDGPQVQTFTLISDGSGDAFKPWFTWQAFRYFDVEGEGTPVEAEVIHTDVAPAADFQCSNENLNWLFDAYKRTQLGNMHSGIPSDCPHRERLGYTGDGQLTVDAAMLTLHARDFYRKWMRDIADSQDPVSGHVQHTAPLQGGGGGPGGWGCAIVEVPWQYYRHYGDTEALRTYYPHMKKWINYMFSRSRDGLVVAGEPGGWCLGDWCTPGEMRIPAPLVNTYFAVRSLNRMLSMAEILSFPGEIPVLQSAKDTFVEGIMTYFDPETGSFAGGVQGADAFALDLGLGDDRTWDNLCRRYEKAKQYDTGIFGTEIVTRLLFRRGRGDLAVSLLAGEKENSFHTMRVAGATTLWERWDGRGSHNHPMFGAVVSHLLYDVAGLRQQETDAGMRRLILEPSDTGLTYARGFVESETGWAEVLWQRNGNTVSYMLQIGGDSTVTYKNRVMTAGIHQWTEAYHA